MPELGARKAEVADSKWRDRKPIVPQGFEFASTSSNPITLVLVIAALIAIAVTLIAVIIFYV